MVREFQFLFTEQISKERIDWLSNLIDSLEISRIKTTIFLTGDSLYSLIDKRLKNFWNFWLERKNQELIIDYFDLRLHGLLQNSLKLLDIRQEQIKNQTRLSFWNSFLENFKLTEDNKTFGVLLNTSPYMNRESVHVVNLLRAIHEKELTPELYCYLDALHIANSNQKPSEFLNIEQELKEISDLMKFHQFNMLGCSRCATARGYVIYEDDLTGEFISDKVIPEFNIVNLNKIIDKYELNFPIIGLPNHINIHGENLGDKKFLEKPELTILISHLPYGTEWVFGALSFALAASNHNIPTNVIFIEDGIANLIGEHFLDENEKIINVQDIILATTDDINYYGFQDSLQIRGWKKQDIFDEIKLLDSKEFAQILINNEISRSTINNGRILFF